MRRVAPWIITVVALYLACRDLEWSTLLSHLDAMQPLWVVGAITLTTTSYLLRARRWQWMFPRNRMAFARSAEVLFVGFFMNNVLPARAGEVVRAHWGSRHTGLTRTEVLATIACERLLDGLSLSVFFVLFAFHHGAGDLSQVLGLVACAFAAALLGVFALLFCHPFLKRFFDRLVSNYQHRAVHYTSSRTLLFLEMLSPLRNVALFVRLALWSALIWSIELMVYVSCMKAFLTTPHLADAVLFMVAVNFSSLVPAAPGGIGVIEVVGSASLQSIGIGKELALSMVILQHIIQYLVVGVPGAILMLGARGTRTESGALDVRALNGRTEPR